MVSNAVNLGKRVPWAVPPERQRGDALGRLGARPTTRASITTFANSAMSGYPRTRGALQSRPGLTGVQPIPTSNLPRRRQLPYL